MNIEKINLSGVDAKHEQQVEVLVLGLMQQLSGINLSVGLDAILSAYISSVANARDAHVMRGAVTCLRQCADLMAAGTFDLTSSAGNPIH